MRLSLDSGLRRSDEDYDCVALDLATLNTLVVPA